ncbi:MAG TPA: hypothetical protein ENJ93_06630 [Chloroflexi bacterium]|nr:hypothetical protein [Chloroflexota bacterium]
MSKRDQILETCLARLAAGESIETCLADYPEDAEWLRPTLAAARQLSALPPQPPRPAADQAIRQRLRQSAWQKAAANRAASRPHRVQIQFFMEDMMKNISRFLFKWLPRIVVSGTAVALLIIFITQFAGPLPFLSGPALEPAVEPPPANVTTVGDATITLEIVLTADPGEVPLYNAQLEPNPATPEGALTWAQNFGLPDPEVYRGVDENDPGLYVLGSDGRRLVFPNYGGYSEIMYSNPAAALISGDPLPFDEAADIAAAFLRDHNMLPDAYRVEPALGDSGPVRQVIIRSEVEGGLIGGDGPGTLRIGVNPDGQVAYANLSRLVLEPAGTVTVISAQAAYDDLLNNRNVLGSAYSTMAVGGEIYRTYQPPSPTWEVGQRVDLVGYLNVLVNADTGVLRVELMGPDQTSYILTGQDLNELSAQRQLGAVRIQGVISAQDSPNDWQVAVETWEAVSPVDFNLPCLTGSLTRSGDTARFHSGDGTEYGLPDAPEEIADGERMEICLAAPAEPGDDLTWYNIRIPPPGDGPPPGGVVTEQVVVEKVVEVAVPPVGMAEGGEEGGSGIGEAVPLAAPTAVLAEPSSPYQIGDEVELTGIVQLYRIKNEEGEERLEAIFVNDGDQGEAAYPFTYPLLAAPELLEEMAEFNELHIRVYGRIVPPPDEGLFFMPNEEQAVAVDRFDRPWPDEKIEQFLGHFSVEEIEGQRVLIFTDHATDQRYVINPPDMPPEAYEHDPILQEEQVLLTGIVHPVKSFGGLPLMERRGTRTGTDVAQATDASQFPPPDFGTIPVMDEAQMPPRDGLAGILHGEVVIERLELVYLYQPQPPTFDGREPEPQLLKPVWAFYGRSVDGRKQFIIQVQATTGG